MVTLKRILVATDFGEAADVALAYGRELARTFGGGLDVLHVVEDVYTHAFAAEGYVAASPELQREIQEMATKRLDALVGDEDRAGLAVSSGIEQAQPIGDVCGSGQDCSRQPRYVMSPIPRARSRC